MKMIHVIDSDYHYDVPDRLTGRQGLAELQIINPKRQWNFVEASLT